jgi:O-antigen/teichoic acid export membrane protein
VRNSSPEDITREAARGTSLVLTGAVIALGAEYVYRFLMARGLGVSGFGTFNQARSIFLILVVLAPLGLAGGVKRFVAAFRESGREREARRVITQGIQVAAASSLLLAALLWLFSPALARAFRNPDLETPLRVLAFAIPAAVGLELVTRLGEAFRSYRPTVLARQVLDPVMRVVLTFPLLLTGASLGILFVALDASVAVALLVAAILVLRLERLRSLAPGPASSQLSVLLHFSLPLAAGTALFDLAERIDVLMIGFYREEADIGVYSAGSSLARFLLIFLASTLPVMATLAAEAAGRGTAQELSRLHRTTTRWMLFSTGPIAAGLLLYPVEAITLLFGPEYSGAGSSLRILVVACLVPALTGPTGLFLDALGKTRWTLAFIVVRVLANILLNLILIPRFGIEGAAWGTLGAILLGTALQWNQLIKHVSLEGNYRGWGRPVLVLAGCSLVSFIAHRAMIGRIPGEHAGVISALLAGMILVASFFLAVRRIPGCAEPEDWEVLRIAWNRARLTTGASGRR